MIQDTIIIDRNYYPYSYRYAVCTIVNKWEEYGEMRDSFENAGFVGDTEYLVADNTNGNVYDAYEAIAGFFRQSRSEFIILVHQDVRAIDNKKQLDYCLQQLDTNYPNWAICGNAGSKGYHQSVTYITYTSHEERYTALPCIVNSLDENFLVIKKDAGLTISSDLNGFHFYGTDLCILAHIIGKKALVIPFMVLHYSKGNINAMEAVKSSFVEQYGAKLNIGYLQTTCTQLYLSNSRKKNKWLNNNFFFFLLKQRERYPYLFKKWMNRG